MSVKFLANNLVESATITASTENAQYPASNLTNDFRTKVWRSTSNSDNIVFDLGSAQEIDHVAMVDNWKNGWGVSTVTIEANATDVWTSPAFTTTLTLDATFGVGIKALSSAQTYRFWRLVFTSTLSYCEAAYIFIGKASDFVTNSIDYGFSYVRNDLKKQSATRYGQEYTDEFGTRKELNGLSVKVMNTTELDVLFDVYDSRKTTKPFIVKIGDGTNTIISNENRLNGLYKFKSAPSVKMKTGVFWETSFSVKEQK